MDGLVFKNTHKLQIAIVMPAIATSDRKRDNEIVDVVTASAGIASSTVT